MCILLKILHIICKIMNIKCYDSKEYCNFIISASIIEKEDTFTRGDPYNFKSHRL